MKRKNNGAPRKNHTHKAKPTPQDWLALLERESRETAKPVEQLLAEKAGQAHPALLKLNPLPWGNGRERIEFTIEGAEKKALDILKEGFTENTNIGTVAFFAMCFALANPEAMERWQDGVVRYAEQEGMSQQCALRSRIWACEKWHKETAVEDDD